MKKLTSNSRESARFNQQISDSGSISMSYSSLLMFLFVMPFVFGLSHFDLMRHINSDVSYVLYVMGLFSICTLPLILANVSVKKNVYVFIVLYALVCVIIYFINSEAFDLFIFIYSMIVIAGVVVYFQKEHVIVGFWRYVYIVGIAALLLNMVTLLYWLYGVDIFLSTANRFEGSDRPDLDPYYFGLFGLTESYEIDKYGLSFARLQGFSVEPQHWGYFVFFILSALTVLRGMRKISYIKFVLFTVFVLFYSMFLVSTSVFISYAVIVISMFVLAMSGRLKKNRDVIVIFFTVVVGVGIIVPFVIGGSLSEEWFYADQIFGEGKNWKGKIEFISIGSSLPYIFFPGQYDLEISHNLPLYLYIQMGWFLFIPFLFFMYLLFYVLLSESNYYIRLSSVIFFVAHLFLIPTIFYSPSFVVWGYMLYMAKKLSLLSSSSMVSAPVRMNKI